jgi:hypothetical protein
MAVQPFVGPWPLFQFINLFTQSLGLFERGISPSQGRSLHTLQHTHDSSVICIICLLCLIVVSLPPGINPFAVKNNNNNNHHHMYPLQQLLNNWTNLYETWYVYYTNWIHLNGVLHKSLPSVCVSICLPCLSLLGNDWVNTFPRQRIHATIEELLDASFSM